VSAARIAAIEARLADVETRHGKAIAILSQFIAERGGEGFEAATQRHRETDRISMLVDALVPKASARLFAEWAKETGRDELGRTPAEREAFVGRLGQIIRKREAEEAGA
jgi:hypothetical protein